MPSPRNLPSRRAVDTLLSAGLSALRRETLGDFDSRHVRIRHALLSPWLNTITGTLGDTLPPDERFPEALRLLLAWSVLRLRPDRSSSFESIDDNAWLHSTSWRPMLALACHHGLLAIPAFPTRYRRHAQEAPVENLCGLWAVGPSTLYRYLDKARHQLVELYSTTVATGEQLLSVRQFVETSMLLPHGHGRDDTAWHVAQANMAFVSGRPMDGMWHLWRGRDIDGLLGALRRYGTEAAGSEETDPMLDALTFGESLDPAQSIEMHLRRSNLWHLRRNVEREGEVLQQALRQAEALNHPLFVGIVHAATARFYEERDRDRAIASYEESAAQLRIVIESGRAVDKTRAVEEYARCVVHMAWLHLRRNNPKAKALLEQVPHIGGEPLVADEVVGALEQTWGEYWRCVGNPRRAIEHKHRALIVFQRLHDQRSVLSTYNNLCLIYGDAKEFELALEYGNRVVAAAQGQTIEPELLSSAHCNLGVIHFSLGHLDQTIAHYESANTIAQKAGLRSLLVVLQYNLAEAHYERFKQSGDPHDEELGDAYAATAARISTEDNAHAQADAARALKKEVLGTGEGPDRLLPSEHAAHFAEMAEVERLRLSLAAPQLPSQQVRTHLAIARAYLAIATKEREAALAIASRHGLTEDFDSELTALRQTFERDLTREQQWAARWQQQASELLQPEQRSAALNRLISAGAINKSGYAEVCGVSLATASKHLGLLAERGLLVQTGKGPSTRYLLPDASH